MAKQGNNGLYLIILFVLTVLASFYFGKEERIQVLPHDSSCYTQGLFIKNGFLYESCGMYGDSRIQKIDLETGAIIDRVFIDKSLFAEGIDWVSPNSIYMLTYRKRQLLMFDLDTLKLRETYSFRTGTGEGWGISNNGTVMAITDGSDVVEFWDPVSLKSVGKVKVKDHNRKIWGLNELEFVGKYELLANVYGSHKIARIDSRTGMVIGWYDFTGILQSHGDPSGNPEVFNGIAVDFPYMYVTGKRWKSMFKISLVA